MINTFNHLDRKVCYLMLSGNWYSPRRPDEYDWLFDEDGERAEGPLQEYLWEQCHRAHFAARVETTSWESNLPVE